METSQSVLEARYGFSIEAISSHLAHTAKAARSADAIARTSAPNTHYRAYSLMEECRRNSGRLETMIQQAMGIATQAYERGNRPLLVLKAINVATNVIKTSRDWAMLRGELTGELGRDRTPAPVAIQVVMPGREGEQPAIRMKAPQNRQVVEAAPVEEEEPAPIPEPDDNPDGEFEIGPL